MRPEEKKYILDNINKRSVKDIAAHLGLKERKVKKFLEAQNVKAGHAQASAGPATLGATFIDNFINSLRPGMLIAALFLAAFAVKFIVLLLFERTIFANLMILDMADYDTWALEISGGQLIGKSAFNALPFYPYILGLIYSIFGHSLFIVRLLQVALGSATCVLVFVLARRMFNPTIGLIAFFSMLLFKEFYAYEMLILPTTLGIFLYVLIIVLLFRALDSPALWKFILLGILTGCSVLNRAYMLYLVPVIPVAIFLSLKSLPIKRYIYTALFTACALAAIAPATIHNYLASKDIVPLTAHGGINFFVGNNPRADGLNIRVPFQVGRGSKEMLSDMKREAEREAGRPLKPSEVSSFWSAKAVSFISANPSAFALLLFTKLNAFFCGFDISDMISPQVLAGYIPLLGIFFLNFRWIVPFALLGIVLTISRRREFLITYAVIIGHIASILLFIVVGRYRLAITPFLIVFWAACLAYLAKCSASNKLPRLGAITLAIAVLFIYFNNPTFKGKYELNPGANYTFIGGYFMDKEDFPNAIEFFRKAVQLEPRRAEAHNMLGLGYAFNEQYKEAFEAYARALSLNPRLYQAHNNMGSAFEKLSMPDKAISEYKKSLETNPDQPATRERLNALAGG